MSDVAKEIGLLLTSLTQQGKLAFAYSVVVRMQPQYQVFYDREGWGDPAVIKASLRAIHDNLVGTRSITHIDLLLDQLEAVIPDLDEHESYLASYAMDAGCAIHSALEYLLKSQDEQIINVAILGRDTVDMYVQELRDLSPNDPALEEKIATDLYMVNEVGRQLSSLQRLQGVTDLDEKLLDELAAGKMIDIDLLPS
ncbi:DUF416 family protein [Siphonobacter sp. SORGH_AS_0500]|uniref:DUF416 family protein n=1 Tax=Siphonobacter sp. SORGH_AS_0500 TaxID=1864824 RepID=UPI0028555D4A|nr:DUF416 family protein [Siphonobacter sp. SORGH_AS_0500]MDR6193288.1 uncharacterized protein YjaG (DUF416 family) [Siphonobacter sp. SORGH_AS_0500]